MKYEEVSRRLINLIQKDGITQQTLADRSGVSKYSISQYVNGTHVPSPVNAVKLGKYFRVDPLWLRGEDVPMRKDYRAIEDRIVQTGGVKRDPIYDKLIAAYADADPKTQKIVRMLLHIDGGES
jgi:transcriptional regulator with XRE-family HTH domain